MGGLWHCLTDMNSDGLNRSSCPGTGHIDLGRGHKGHFDHELLSSLERWNLWIPGNQMVIKR